MDFLPAVAMFVAETSKTTTPTAPGIGALIAWWICDRHKREPIGGWLQYFYWSLYGGAAFTLVAIAMKSSSYIPEYSGNTRNYLLFLGSAVPGIVMLFVQVIIGTFLLTIRTPEILRLFRWVLGISIAVGLIGIGLDTLFNPDNIPLAAYGLFADSCWLLYFVRSKRVRHVFQTNDWEVAVTAIYPPKAGSTAS